MPSVEGIDVATVVEVGPACCLDRPGNFEGQFIKEFLLLVCFNFSFDHQAKQVAVSGNVVETVVMHAYMRNMGCHQFHRVRAADLQKLLFSGRVVLQESQSELEALRPFSPAAAGISACNSKHRSALLGVPRFLNGENLLGGQLEDPMNSGHELPGFKLFGAVWQRTLRLVRESRFFLRPFRRRLSLVRSHYQDWLVTARVAL